MSSSAGAAAHTGRHSSQLLQLEHDRVAEATELERAPLLLLLLLLCLRLRGGGHLRLGCVGLDRVVRFRLACCRPL